MPDLTISSLRGGLSEDPPISLKPDQCTIAENVEWNTSAMGERRRGSDAINMAGSGLETSGVLWLYRHLPTTNLSDAQLWAFGWTTGGPRLVYKDTSWHTVAMPDPPVQDGISEYHVCGQTLHGKLFIAYRSNVDRLHVFEGGTALRRCGLAGVGAAPFASDAGGAGTVTGTRYYRVRYVLAGKLRSEPTPDIVFTPSGSNSSVTITRPPGPGEGEDQWELEASVNRADWYRISTHAIATTAASDAVSATAGYAAFPLSEDIGAYTVIPSGKFLSVDEDRLLVASHWTDQAIQSRVMWTPPYAATGVGNDERLDLSTNPYLDLDNFEGGMISAMSSNVNGYIYIGKFHHLYQLTRTGVRTRAYEAIPLTKSRGALISSMVEGFDQGGQPFVFCLDPDIGPVRIGGPRGVEPCGADLIRTWERANLDATIPARALYFPEKRQIHWWIAVDGSSSPNLRLVLHTHLMRAEQEGARGGYATFTGFSSQALSCCMFADNIDANTARSRFLKPFMGLGGGLGSSSIWRGDTGNHEEGAPYVARMQSKPFGQGGMLDQFEVGEACLLAAAEAGAIVDITIRGLRADRSTVERTLTAIDLTMRAGELPDEVLRAFDNLSLAEMQTVQIDIRDHVGSNGQWAIHQVALSITGGQKARAA